MFITTPFPRALDQPKLTALFCHIRAEFQKPRLADKALRSSTVAKCKQVSHNPTVTTATHQLLACRFPPRRLCLPSEFSRLLRCRNVYIYRTREYRYGPVVSSNFSETECGKFKGGLSLV